MPANKKWIFFCINVMSPFEILLFCFLEYYGFNLKVESIFMKLSCNRCNKKNSPRIIIIDEIVKVHLIEGKLILRVRKQAPDVTLCSVFRKSKLAQWKASCFSLFPAGGEAVLCFSEVWVLEGLQCRWDSVPSSPELRVTHSNFTNHLLNQAIAKN